MQTLQQFFAVPPQWAIKVVGFYYENNCENVVFEDQFCLATRFDEKMNEQTLAQHLADAIALEQTYNDFAGWSKTLEIRKSCMFIPRYLYGLIEKRLREVKPEFFAKFGQTKIYIGLANPIAYRRKSSGWLATFSPTTITKTSNLRKKSVILIRLREEIEQIVAAWYPK